MTDGKDDHGVTASADLATLIDLLDVERVDDDLFIGQHPEQVTARTFGGQLMGQGVVAAGRTITKGNPPVHALHAHFVRGGDVSKPLEYHVDRFRDGRAFANRQVTAKQNGEVVFTMLVAFQDNSAGPSTPSRSPRSRIPKSSRRSTSTSRAMRTRSRPLSTLCTRSTSASPTTPPG